MLAPQTLQSFDTQFAFNPKLAGYLGVERECFIVDNRGALQPMAEKILPTLVANDGLRSPFGYELSACQIEMRSKPHKTLKNLGSELRALESRLTMVLQRHNLAASHVEVGPEDMPLDVYPDPTGRYQTLKRDRPREWLLAACRTIGTHVHIGMPDKDTAIRVHNHLAKSLTRLQRIGDHSDGARLRIYNEVAGDSTPLPYDSWDAFRDDAANRGFYEDPRRNWRQIRISRCGTVEVRVFGATKNIEKISEWANKVRNYCFEVM